VSASVLGHTSVSASSVNQLPARQPAQGPGSGNLVDGLRAGDTLLVFISWDHHVPSNSRAVVSLVDGGPHSDEYTEVSAARPQSSSPTSWGHVFRKTVSSPADEEGRSIYVRPLSGTTATSPSLSTNSLNVHVIALREVGSISVTESDTVTGVRQVPGGAAGLPGAEGIQIAMNIDHSGSPGTGSGPGFEPLRSTSGSNTALQTLQRRVFPGALQVPPDGMSELTSSGHGHSRVLFCSTGGAGIARTRSRRSLGTQVIGSRSRDFL